MPADGASAMRARGAAIFQDAMRWERSRLFAAYVGRLERLAEVSADDARTRDQFGRPIGSNQAVLAPPRAHAGAPGSGSLLLWRACG